MTPDLESLDRKIAELIQSLWREAEEEGFHFEIITLKAETMKKASLVKLRELKVSGKEKELDPEDQWAERLLHCQEVLHRAYDEITRAFEKTPEDERERLRRLGLGQVQRAFYELHQALGELRTFILEHDASLSPVVGPFETAEELFRALDEERE